MALLVAAPAAWLLLGSRDSSTQARASALAETMRIAILPFVNLTGDEAANYVADGLTDELIARLGGLGGERFSVIARTSSMAYRNTTKTIHAIAADLDVDYIVEGSLRREGETLRITTSTNCHVVNAWARFSVVRSPVGALEIGSTVKRAATTSRTSDPM